MIKKIATTSMNIQATLRYLRPQGFESDVLKFKDAENTYDFRKLRSYFSALSNEANLVETSFRRKAEEK